MSRTPGWVRVGWATSLLGSYLTGGVPPPLLTVSATSICLPFQYNMPVYIYMSYNSSGRCLFRFYPTRTDTHIFQTRFHLTTRPENGPQIIKREQRERDGGRSNEFETGVTRTPRRRPARRARARPGAAWARAPAHRARTAQPQARRGAAAGAHAGARHKFDYSTQETEGVF